MDFSSRCDYMGISAREDRCNIVRRLFDALVIDSLRLLVALARDFFYLYRVFPFFIFRKLWK